MNIFAAQPPESSPHARPSRRITGSDKRPHRSDRNAEVVQSCCPGADASVMAPKHSSRLRRLTFVPPNPNSYRVVPASTALYHFPSFHSEVVQSGTPPILPIPPMPQFRHSSFPLLPLPH